MLPTSYSSSLKDNFSKLSKIDKAIFNCLCCHAPEYSALEPDKTITTFKDWQLSNSACYKKNYFLFVYPSKEGTLKKVLCSITAIKCLDDIEILPYDQISGDTKLSAISLLPSEYLDSWCLISDMTIKVEHYRKMSATILMDHKKFMNKLNLDFTEPCLESGDTYLLAYRENENCEWKELEVTWKYDFASWTDNIIVTSVPSMSTSLRLRMEDCKKNWLLTRLKCDNRLK